MELPKGSALIVKVPRLSILSTLKTAPLLTFASWPAPSSRVLAPVNDEAVEKLTPPLNVSVLPAPSVVTELAVIKPLAVTLPIVTLRDSVRGPLITEPSAKLDMPVIRTFFPTNVRLPA